jgi:hypothetical protein
MTFLNENDAEKRSKKGLCGVWCRPRHALFRVTTLCTLAFENSAFPAVRILSSHSDGSANAYD